MPNQEEGDQAPRKKQRKLLKRRTIVFDTLSGPREADTEDSGVDSSSTPPPELETTRDDEVETYQSHRKGVEKTPMLGPKHTKFDIT